MSASIYERLSKGLVIPAHPLALTADRKLDERHQRALTRYYLDAGAGGVAVGVHTTQFAIHDDAGLLRAVVQLAAEEAANYRVRSDRQVVLIAGAVGDTRQSVGEADMARDLGYDAVLLTPQPDVDEDAQVERVRSVAAVMPIIAFCLQSAVGGPPLRPTYWQRIFSIEGVVGVKVAPFSRYRTVDVLRALATCGRSDEIVLYTGNDDHILLDLVSSFDPGGGSTPVRFVGGLLGQWAVWTRRAVEHLDMAHRAAAGDDRALRSLLGLDGQLTEANAAIFDATNAFKGCVPGIHEVLRRHGLLQGRWCLDKSEDVSPGQLDAIDEVWARHPHLRDDDFIDEHRDGWLA